MVIILCVTQKTYHFCDLKLSTLHCSLLPL